MRSELSKMDASKVAMEAELTDVLLQLHSVQLQQQADKGVEVDSSVIKRKVVSKI